MQKTISLLLTLVFALTLLTACGAESTSSANTGKREPTPETSEQEPKREAIETVIADDTYITASFEKMYDATSMGVEGVFYVDIKAENKTDKAIWVYLDKASVNDETVPMVMTGIPFYIQPGKTGQTGFIFSFSSLSIDKIDDVKKIEFDLVVAEQESLAEIDRIGTIIIEF